MLTAIKFHVGLTPEERATLPTDLVPGLTYLVKWSRLDAPMRAQIETLPTDEHSFIEFWVFLDDDFKIGPCVEPNHGDPDPFR